MNTEQQAAARAAEILKAQQTRPGEAELDAPLPYDGHVEESDDPLMPR